jgi:hypothetical protein
MVRSDAVDEVLRKAKSSDDSIVFDIGVALQYTFAPRNTRYAAPYPEMGKEFLAAAKFELYKLLCDSTKKAPKRWLEDLVSGDARDAVIAILTLLVASLQIPLSIAVPVTAIIVKRQLLAFCRRKPNKPRCSTSQILDDHKQRHKKSRKA